MPYAFSQPYRQIITASVTNVTHPRRSRKIMPTLAITANGTAPKATAVKAKEKQKYVQQASSVFVTITCKV